MNIKQPNPDILLPPESDFSKKLHWLMARDGVTHKQLAAAIDRTERTVFRYCNRSIKPRGPIAKKIADYFMVDANWLLKDERKNRGLYKRKLVEDSSMYDTTYNYMRTINMPEGIRNSTRNDIDRIVSEEIDIPENYDGKIKVDVAYLNKKFALKVWGKDCDSEEFLIVVRMVNETADYLIDILREERRKEKAAEEKLWKNDRSI